MTNRILQSRKDVEPFLGQIIAASDANGGSLGFFPRSFFEASLGKETILVATPDGSKLAGYILYSTRFPRATVLQAYCDPAFRRTGVGRQLIDSLKHLLGGMDFLSIKASVAEDLGESNAFYEAQGFLVASRRRGGESKNRQILVRIHELESPQLFPRSCFAESGHDSLALAVPSQAAPARFIVDLNVLFDIAKRRAHANLAVALFLASHEGRLKIEISDEIDRELQRNTSGQADPMVEMIRALPQVVIPVGDEYESLEKRISAIVFPEKQFPSQLTKNDRSDIRHLLAAAVHLRGFITRDGKILEAAAELERQFGVVVLHPSAFAAQIRFGAEQAHWLIDGQSSMTIGPAATSDNVEVLKFLGKVVDGGIPATSEWVPRSSQAGVEACRVVRIDGQVVGFSRVSSLVPGKPDILVRAAVLEGNDASMAVARALLQHLRSELSNSQVVRVVLQLPKGQPSLREEADRLGFRTSPAGGGLVKVSAATLAWSGNWQMVSSAIAIASGLSFPSAPPSTWGDLVEVRVPSGERRLVQIGSLERILSPLLLWLPGRNAVLVSIQRDYSEMLLGVSPQGSLVPRATALSFEERQYLSGRNTFKAYQKDSLIFFYESGSAGAQAVIAVARINDSFLVPCDEADEKSLERAVLAPSDLSRIGKSETKAACIFSSLLPLACPVSLRSLNEIGVTNSALQTVRRLSDNQVKKIIELGFQSD